MHKNDFFQISMVSKRFGLKSALYVSYIAKKHSSLIPLSFCRKILPAKTAIIFFLFLGGNSQKLWIQKRWVNNPPPFLGRVGLFDRGCFISRHKVQKCLTLTEARSRFLEVPHGEKLQNVFSFYTRMKF